MQNCDYGSILVKLIAILISILKIVTALENMIEFSSMVLPSLYYKTNYILMIFELQMHFMKVSMYNKSCFPTD